MSPGWKAQGREARSSRGFASDRRARTSLKILPIGCTICSWVERGRVDGHLGCGWAPWVWTLTLGVDGHLG